MLRKFRGLLLAMSAVFLISATANAQMDIGLKSVGGHLGLVVPDVINASGFGSSIELGGVVGLGTVMENLEVEGNVDFWRKSKTYAGGTYSFTDFSFGGTGKYFVDIGMSKIRTYGSAGLAFHILHWAWDYNNSYYGYPIQDNSDSKFRIGINIGGGAQYALSPNLDLVGEAKYHLVNDANQFTFTVGALFTL